MPDLGWPELVIIAVVVLVLFGSKKLPDTARSIGRSLRILKSETKGLREDDETPAVAAPQQAQAIAPAPAAAPAQQAAVPEPVSVEKN